MPPSAGVCMTGVAGGVVARSVGAWPDAEGWVSVLFTLKAPLRFTSLVFKAG